MSDYLDEEEQIARMKSWWDVNGNSVITGVVVAVVGIVGWNWYGSYDEERGYEAARAYQSYLDAGDVDRDGALAALAAEHEGTAYHTFALLSEARTATDAGDLEAARDALEAAVASADDALLQDLARVRLARMQQALGTSDEALTTLSQVRSEGYRAWVLEVQGDIHAARGDVESAHAAYDGAVAALRPGDERPLLSMKLENTAPFDDAFVPMTGGLKEVLDRALETLEAAEAAEATEGTEAVDALEAADAGDATAAAEAGVAEAAEAVEAAEALDALATEPSDETVVEESTP